MQETFYQLEAPVRCRLALVADLHDKNGTKAIASLRRRKPEIIAVSGDLVYGDEPHEESLFLAGTRHTLSFLRACAETAPTFVSLGNHEWMVGGEDLALIRETGAVPLDNRWVSHGAFTVGGLSSGYVTDYRAFRARWNREHGLQARYPADPNTRRRRRLFPESGWLDAFEAEPGYKLLLCHHPEYWALQEPFLKRRRIDLVLAGHAHGGQIRLFGHGLYAPGQGLLPAFTAGVHAGEHGTLVVSRGLANTVCPIPRLFNPRELVYLELG